MSTTVIPHGANGRWEMTSIAPEDAASLAQSEAFVSAVGHESSAQAMTAALGVPVAQNRLTVIPVPGDRFLCLRLLSRPPEGWILDADALEMIGYDFALLHYYG